MRNRTFWELEESKHLYRKHAARFKTQGYPEHRTKRFFAYSAAMTKAIQAYKNEERNHLTGATNRGDRRIKITI